MTRPEIAGFSWAGGVVVADSRTPAGGRDGGYVGMIELRLTNGNLPDAPGVSGQKVHPFRLTHYQGEESSGAEEFRDAITAAIDWLTFADDGVIDAEIQEYGCAECGGPARWHVALRCFDDHPGALALCDVHTEQPTLGQLHNRCPRVGCSALIRMVRTTRLD